jgi:hypothetical protein
LQSIARLSSQNFFKIFARLAKHLQTKLLAIQGSTVLPFPYIIDNTPKRDIKIIGFCATIHQSTTLNL